ncbi:MAG: hypothetical protein ACI9C1_001445 [Candidatus Aldehydirespiratoraceae bacterium]|jgi:hypothetical protein
MSNPPCAHLNFVIIGAMKAGTTSAFDFLASHPSVFAPRNKEPHYFSRGYRMPASYYRRLFRERGAGQLCGEASPTYSWTRRYPEVPERIANDAPNTKIIYLVRDPLERWLSHYRHHLLLGNNYDSFIAATAEDGLWDRGRYQETALAYLEHFPRERLFVADLHDLNNDAAWRHRMLAFLGLTPTSDTAAELPRSNASADRDVVPGVLGRIARTPVGAVVRDLVPKERLQRMKGTVSREADGSILDVDVTTEMLRDAQPERANEVLAEYEWVRAEFIEEPENSPD